MAALVSSRALTVELLGGLLLVVRNFFEEHSAAKVSWGRFEVLDVIMSKMTDEIEKEAKARTGPHGPVTVDLKRAIRDEKSSRNWQAVLASNKVRYAPLACQTETVQLCLSEQRRTL